MPDIRATPSSALLTSTQLQAEKNTHNLEDWLRLLISETRRLRLGDVSENDEELIR